jgi:hypothetical protein
VNGKKSRAGAEKIRGVEIFGLWTTQDHRKVAIDCEIRFGGVGREFEGDWSQSDGQTTDRHSATDPKCRNDFASLQAFPRFFRPFSGHSNIQCQTADATDAKQQQKFPSSPLLSLLKYFRKFFSRFNVFRAMASPNSFIVAFVSASQARRSQGCAATLVEVSDFSIHLRHLTPFSSSSAGNFR